MRCGARNFKKLIPLTFVRQPESLWLMLGLECTSALARAYVHEGGQTIVGKTSGARGGCTKRIDALQSMLHELGGFGAKSADVRPNWSESKRHIP